jgi:parallel beta-helix repeat protein
MTGSPLKKILKHLAWALVFGCSSLHGLNGAFAAGLRILSVQEIPTIVQKIERQRFDSTARPDIAAAKAALQSVIDDLRSLSKTATGSVIGDLEALQASQTLARDALDQLSGKGITEDSVTLELVEISSRQIADGAAGADLIDMTVELTGYVTSIKSPIFLRKANLSLAEAFAKAGKGKVAAKYLRQAVGNKAMPLDAESLDRLSTNLAGLIADGDISILRDLVLSVPNSDERESLLFRLAQNAVLNRQALGMSSKRLDRWRDVLASRDNAKALSAIVQSVLDSGDDEFAGVLSQANAKFADAILKEAIDRRVSERYALRAQRLAEFVSDAAQAKQFEERIARLLDDAGYLAMAKALFPEIRTAQQRAVSQLQLPASVLALANINDYPAAISQIQALPGSTYGEAMQLLADYRIEGGDLPGAAQMVRAIPDYSVRTKIFRQIAERRAAALDSYGILGGAATRPPAKAHSEVGEFRQIIGVDFDWAPSKNATEKFPTFNIPNVSADTVRASAPAITPGSASMVLARYNKRIGLSGASATDDIGVFGANIREHLFAAQGSVVPAVLMVDSGVHSLADLVQTASEISHDAIVAEGEAFKISIPIFVRPGATLVLSGLEAKEYRLDTNSGAFIMNSGTLIIADTTLLAFDYKRGRPDHRSADEQQSFRPFVTSWSGSKTEIANSQIKNLGYFGGRSYGFTMVSDPVYIRDRQVSTNKPTGTIVDSTFENLLYGLYTYEAEDVLVVGNEYRDNIIYGLDPHDRSHRLVIAYNTAYGSIEKHGGIISREVDDSLIVGNVAFSNTGAGLMIERNSTGNIVYANSSFNNGGDGIAIYESPCNLVESNDSFANRNAGIKVRNSWNVLVRANLLHANKGAGLEAAIADVTAITGSKERDLQSDPFHTYVELDARQNELTGNRAGILAKGASRITLESNVFHSQTPDTFAGDLKSYRAQLLRPELGRVEANAKCLPARPKTESCSLETAGLPGSSTKKPAAPGTPAKYCTDEPGSLQQRALTSNQAGADTQ